MRVFLPSRMTIASNLAVPRYITRTKITLWTRFLSFRIDFFFFLSLVNNFLSLHYFEINHSISISIFSLFRTSSRKSAFEYFTDLETISLQDPCIFQREKFRQLLPRLEENFLFLIPFFHRLPRYSFRRIPSRSFCFAAILAAIDYCSRTKKKRISLVA